MNFDDYLNYVRINRASERLLKTDKILFTIAVEVGYNTKKTEPELYSLPLYDTGELPEIHPAANIKFLCHNLEIFVCLLYSQT